MNSELLTHSITLTADGDVIVTTTDDSGHQVSARAFPLLCYYFNGEMPLRFWVRDHAGDDVLAFSFRREEDCNEHWSADVGLYGDKAILDSVTLSGEGSLPRISFKATSDHTVTCDNEVCCYWDERRGGYVTLGQLWQNPLEIKSTSDKGSI